MLKALHDFVFGEQEDKVFILYVLRRIGTGTLLMPRCVPKPNIAMARLPGSLSSIAVCLRNRRASAIWMWSVTSKLLPDQILQKEWYVKLFDLAPASAGVFSLMWKALRRSGFSVIAQNSIKNFCLEPIKKFFEDEKMPRKTIRIYCKMGSEKQQKRRNWKYRE